MFLVFFTSKEQTVEQIAETAVAFATTARVKIEEVQLGVEDETVTEILKQQKSCDCRTKSTSGQASINQNRVWRAWHSRKPRKGPAFSFPINIKRHIKCCKKTTISGRWTSRRIFTTLGGVFSLLKTNLG